MPESELAGRVALITGAASGIGLALLRRLVGAGARVVALDLSSDGLERISQELGDGVRCVVGDVRSPEDNERAVSTAVEHFGSLDVLIPNAGVFDGNVELDGLDAPTLLSAADEILGINVLGYLLAARAAIPHLRQSHGSIVFTVSNAGFHPGAGGGILYTISKHAVVGLVRQLAFELAPDVRVNGVAPGGTLTGLRIAPTLRGVVGSDRHFADRERSERLIGETNPLRVVAQPEDHVDVYLLLASPSARAITGEIVSSDGGLGVRGIGFEQVETGGD